METLWDSGIPSPGTTFLYAGLVCWKMLKKGSDNAHIPKTYHCILNSILSEIDVDLVA